MLESEKLEPNTNYLLKIKTDDFERIVHMVFHQITIATPEIIPIPLTEPEIGKEG